MTAVQQLIKNLQDRFPTQMEAMYDDNQYLFEHLTIEAKVMEEQEKVEFAFRAYSEKLSTDKDFVEIVDSMRTLKQQEQ